MLASQRAGLGMGLARLTGASTSLTPAADRAALARLDAFLRGVEAYRGHPWRARRHPLEPRWQAGSTSLTASARDGPPVLLIPSLINRAEVLDLAPGISLVAALERTGHQPWLLDWGDPDPTARDFGLADWLGRRLEPALEAVRAATGRRPALLGYCLGGLLALALAARRPEALAGLVLIATPWDFHAHDGGRDGTTRALAWSALEPLLNDLREVPPDLVQAAFVAADPDHVLERFAAFAAVDPDSAAARRFVALQDWANGGAALPLATARDLVLDLQRDNLPARGHWAPGGQAVLIAGIRHPALVLIAARDRLVPPASARALGAALPNATVLDLPLSHTGLVIGRQARRQVWRPITRFLARLSGAAGTGHDRGG